MGGLILTRRKAKEDVGFAHCGVSQDDKFDEMIVFLRLALLTEFVLHMFEMLLELFKPKYAIKSDHHKNMSFRMNSLRLAKRLQEN